MLTQRIKFYAILSFTLFRLLNFARAEEVSNEAPFQIPQEGEPGQLVGEQEFPGPSAFAFDSQNRPYLLTTYLMYPNDLPETIDSVLTLRDGVWVRRSFRTAIEAAAEGEDIEFLASVHGLGSISFDSEDGMYLIARTSKPEHGRFLVYSSDFGENFQAYPLPARNWAGAFLETHTGHNLQEAPPAIGLLVDSNQRSSRWSYVATLSVILPRRDGDRLLLEPVEITQRCLGISNHSGGYSSFATVGNLTHVVYVEFDREISGNPTYIATIDRTTSEVIARQHLFNAHPGGGNVHSTPVITVDGDGILHVLSGAHNGPFLYTRSLQPNNIEEGWSEPGPMHRRQTYSTLVCDQDNNLHSVYRIHGGLYHQTLKAGADEWSEPKELVSAPGGGYTCFYHQLITDQSGRIFLSFTYINNDRGRPQDFPQALVLSADQGATWQLARTKLLE